MKGQRDNQAYLVDSDVSEITPEKLSAAIEKDSSNLDEEQVMALACT